MVPSLGSWRPYRQGLAQPDPAIAAIGDDLLFYMVASASFVEITSDVYTGNLIRFFEDDPELAGWLEQTWQNEELGHGVALKRYVETTWPGFDWATAYRRFYDEYTQFCRVDQLQKTKALQLAALCVVETGTSSFYRMIADLSPDPALKRLALRISAEEIGHYKMFYRHFRRRRAAEQTTHIAVLRSLWTRMCEIDDTDAFYAFKHVFLQRNPGIDFEKAHYEAFRRACTRVAKAHFPCEMAVKMLLKPVGLSPAVGKLALPPITSVTRYVMFR